MNPASAPLLADARAPDRLRPPPPPAPAALPGWPVAVLGVPFDPVTTEHAIAAIDRMIASQLPHYIVTANVDFLVQAHRDVELRRILLEADLVLCDGTPILWASQFLGNRLPERVAGSDLAPALVASAAAKGQRIFLLGAAEGVAAAAADRLQREYPGLQIAGHYAPPFSALLDMNHAEIVRRVREAKPDILLVSFGCPKQEKWIAMHHRALGVPVAIGVGATLDFLAGRMKRAPGWMRRTGTEWLYRLAQEPRRLYRRYANDLVSVLPILARQWWRLGRDLPAPGSAREMPVARRGWWALDAGERLTRSSLQRQAALWEAAQDRATHCLLDLSRLQRLDATGVALLIRWRKRLHARGRQLVLLSPSLVVRRVLESMKLADHFIIAQDPHHAPQETEAMLAQPTVQCRGETRALAWCGEVIAANVDDVWRTTQTHLQAFVAAEATLVIIDISQLRFIDSSGVSLMIRLKKWARSQRVELLFSHPQPNIRNVLRLTRTDLLLLEGGQ